MSRPIFITCKGFQTDEHLTIVQVARIQSVEWVAGRPSHPSSTRIFFADGASVAVDETPADVRRLIDEALKGAD